jgi:hypothetical protein
VNNSASVIIVCSNLKKTVHHTVLNLSGNCVVIILIFSLRSLQHDVQRFDWWESNDRHFSDGVLDDLFVQLCNACSSLDFDKVEWFLVQWKAPITLCSKSERKDRGFSPTDWVVISGHNYEHLAKICRWTHTVADY